MTKLQNTRKGFENDLTSSSKNCLRRSSQHSQKNLRYLPSYISKEKMSLTQVKINEILQFREGTVYDLISGHALKKT